MAETRDHETKDGIEIGPAAERPSSVLDCLLVTTRERSTDAAGRIEIVGVGAELADMPSPLRALQSGIGPADIGVKD